LRARYARTTLSAAWIVLPPLCLLGIYTFVFSYLLKVSWHMPTPEGDQQAGFVLPFFVGLSLYLTLADLVNSSATLYTSKRTFVVKSPFPLWVLWLANLLRAGVHASVTLVMVIALAAIQGRLTALGLGGVAMAVGASMLFLASLSLFLSNLGPFMGDISEINRLVLRVLFYLTPISYPLALVPEQWRALAWLNPLTCMVEMLRDALVFGQLPPLGIWAAFVGGTLLFTLASVWMFRRVKGVIADVV
jgi:lipopolysaccharide transport system permease protein